MSNISTEFWAQEKNDLEELGIQVEPAAFFDAVENNIEATQEVQEAVPEYINEDPEPIPVEIPKEVPRAIIQWREEKEKEIARIEEEAAQKEETMKKTAQSEREKWLQNYEENNRKLKENAKKTADEASPVDRTKIWSAALSLLGSNSLKMQKSSRDTSSIKSAMTKIKDKVETASS